MLKISPSSSAESSTTISTSVWGLKYTPGRVTISSRGWLSEAIGALYTQSAPRRNNQAQIP